MLNDTETTVTTDTLPIYDQLLAQASRLPPTDQLRLLEELAPLVRQRMMYMTPEPPPSITALRGLGKEVWQGIDAQEYVDRERASWDG